MPRMSRDGDDWTVGYKGSESFAVRNPNTYVVTVEDHDELCGIVDGFDGVWGHRAELCSLTRLDSAWVNVRT